MKIKQKRAMEGGTWWLIVGAVLAIAISVIILFIVKGGLFAGKKNVDFLSSCKNQGGTCRIECKEDEIGFYGLNCPDEDGSGEIDGSEKKENKYCCIKKKSND
jgi:hypothetical protein